MHDYVNHPALGNYSRAHVCGFNFKGYRLMPPTLVECGFDRRRAQPEHLSRQRPRSGEETEEDTVTAEYPDAYGNPTGVHV